MVCLSVTYNTVRRVALAGTVRLVDTTNANDGVSALELGFGIRGGGGRDQRGHRGRKAKNERGLHYVVGEGVGCAL